jgi:hypothetical protein
MKTKLIVDAETALFVISEIDPKYKEAVLGLYYTPFEDGYAKQFPADTPHLRRIYQRFEQSVEEMIKQSARMRPVPWGKALGVFMDKIEDEPIKWRIAGSVGPALRGIEVEPRDIDLVVDNESAQKLGAILAEYMVEPVVSTQGWIANWFGRAFMFARVEWVGVDDPYDVDGLRVVNWRGREIRVPPLKMHLEEDENRGLIERAEKIKEYLLSQKEKGQ